MAIVARAVAALRIMGDLDPNELTTLLGTEPSSSQSKGEVLVGKVTGIRRQAKFGAWHLQATETAPADLDAQVQELLCKLTSDLGVWRELGRRFDIDLFCGWFMEGGNEGVTVSASTLLALGERGIELSMDIYDGEEGDDEIDATTAPDRSV